MENDNKLAALEGLLFVVGDDGLSVKEEYENPNRGIRLHFLCNTFKLTTKQEHRKYYQKLLINEENNTLSNSALETLAIVAYNEPITRVDVDEIRGVQTSQMIRKLVAKGLLKECGRSELPGRPILYKTTSEFLDYFGLSDISELPKITPKSERENNDLDLYKSKYEEEIIE